MRREGLVLDLRVLVYVVGALVHLGVAVQSLALRVIAVRVR